MKLKLPISGISRANLSGFLISILSVFSAQFLENITSDDSIDSLTSKISNEYYIGTQKFIDKSEYTQNSRPQTEDSDWNTNNTSSTLQIIEDEVQHSDDREPDNFFQNIDDILSNNFCDIFENLDYCKPLNILP